MRDEVLFIYFDFFPTPEANLSLECRWSFCPEPMTCVECNLLTQSDYKCNITNWSVCIRNSQNSIYCGIHLILDRSSRFFLSFHNKVCLQPKNLKKYITEQKNTSQNVNCCTQIMIRFETVPFWAPYAKLLRGVMIIGKLGVGNERKQRNIEDTEEWPITSFEDALYRCENQNRSMFFINTACK